MTKALILMGPSGGGKSRYAPRLLGGGYIATSAIIASADTYPGLYGYGEAPSLDFSKLGAAHAACFRDYLRALASVPILDFAMCDNTNTTLVELAPYVAAARAYDVEPEIVCIGADMSVSELFERNQHNVPRHAIERQVNNLGDTLENWPTFWPDVRYVSGRG